MKFIISPLARRNIEEIVRYIAEDNVTAALKLQDQFEQAFRTLAQFPDAGHRRRDLAGNRNLLFWTTGNYLVPYRVRSKQIEIVAVLHASRDIYKALSHRKSNS